MIYIDSSVVLAQLLAEDRFPGEGFWQGGPFCSSRLLEYEVWHRINARGLVASHADDVRLLLGRLAFLELAPVVLARALEPFPIAVRTLDALHLASIEFLRGPGSVRCSPATTAVSRRPPPHSTSRLPRSDGRTIATRSTSKHAQTVDAIEAVTGMRMSPAAPATQSGARNSTTSSTKRSRPRSARSLKR